MEQVTHSIKTESTSSENAHSYSQISVRMRISRSKSSGSSRIVLRRDDFVRILWAHQAIPIKAGPAEEERIRVLIRWRFPNFTCVIRVSYVCVSVWKGKGVR